jgi:hypothetical protein
MKYVKRIIITLLMMGSASMAQAYYYEYVHPYNAPQEPTNYGGNNNPYNEHSNPSRFGGEVYPYKETKNESFNEYVNPYNDTTFRYYVDHDTYVRPYNSKRYHFEYYDYHYVFID